jgi:hypothetical protein
MTPVRCALPLNVGQLSADASWQGSTSAAKASVAAIALIVDFTSDAPSVYKYFLKTPLMNYKSYLAGNVFRPRLI